MDGIRKARERGMHFGRKKTLTLQQIAELQQQRKQGALIKKRPLQSRGYAACCTDSSLVVMPGYHRQKMSRSSPFNTCVRTWRSRWAPRLVHFICCCFTKRWLIT